MLVEPLDQLFLALHVHDDHDGPASRLQKSHYPVVSVGRNSWIFSSGTLPRVSSGRFPLQF